MFNGSELQKKPGIQLPDPQRRFPNGRDRIIKKPSSWKMPFPAFSPARSSGLTAKNLSATISQAVSHWKNLFEKEKLAREDLEEVLQSWLNLWEILGEYLLDTDFLLLDPSYLYRETQSGNYRFVWFPYRIREKWKDFQALTEYFLPRIDHKDKEAVALGYGVYKEAVEENIRPAVVKELLWEANPRKNPEDTALSEEDSDFSHMEDPEKEAREKERQKILDEFYSEEGRASRFLWDLGRNRRNLSVMCPCLSILAFSTFFSCPPCLLSDPPSFSFRSWHPCIFFSGQKEKEVFSFSPRKKYLFC